MEARKQTNDRVVRSAEDLGEGRTVSLDEAVNALESFNGPIETIAHRANNEHDDTALLVIGQVDKGEGCTTIRALIGNGLEISFAIARAMKEEPAFRAAVRRALMIDKFSSILD